MKKLLAVGTFLALAFVAPARANTEVKIDTVRSQHTPIDSPTSREPVSLSDFHFEVNKQTGRVRVVGPGKWSLDTLFREQGAPSYAKRSLQHVAGRLEAPAA